MKVLVLAIDALDPRILLENVELFPNMKRIIEEGVGGPYAGYAYGYGSYDNWITLYTGLDPKDHQVINNKFKGFKKPIVQDYIDKKPFWEILNKEAGLTVGVFNGCVTTPTTAINGYMAANDRQSRFEDTVKEEEVLTPIFDDKHAHLQKYLSGELRFPKRPRSVEDFGYTWEQVKQDNSMLEEIFKDDDYYQDGLIYLEHVLEFLETNIKILEEKQPVDVMWVYTEAMDTLQHFQAYAKNQRIILEAMQKIDEFIGRVREALKPENIIVLSDHGISSIASMLQHESVEIQKEAFGWRDKSYWIDNEIIVSPARNGGIISGLHDYKGTFLAAGLKIKNALLQDMRSIDFYPTFLELCGAKIPEEREGMVLDIFKEEILNLEKKYIQENEKKILLLQNLDVNLFNTVINEVFLANRGAELTLMCEEKYVSIFKNNTRLSKVMGVRFMTDTELDSNQYDFIITGYYNAYKNITTPMVVRIKK